MEKPSLDELFKAALNALPEIVGNMQPLGHGDFGIAVGNEGTVHKILYRLEDEKEAAHSFRQFERETAILKALAGQKLEDIEVPVLIGDPEILSSQKFMATYSMTRLHGRTNPIVPLDKNLLDDFEQKYKSTGALLARFHRAVRDMDLGEALPKGFPDGTSVLQSSFFDEETNNKLSSANHYLQANMRSGNIHGDANLGNVIERDGIAIGLIDFSFAGHVENMMTEFWTAPTQYHQSLIQGYEAESGESIEMMVHATSLSMWSHLIVNPDNKLEAIDDMKLKAQKLLLQMAPVLRT